MCRRWRWTYPQAQAYKAAPLMVAITGPCTVGLFKTYLMNTSAQITSRTKMMSHLTDLPVHSLTVSIVFSIFLIALLSPAPRLVPERGQTQIWLHYVLRSFSLWVWPNQEVRIKSSSSWQRHAGSPALPLFRDTLEPVHHSTRQLL